MNGHAYLFGVWSVGDGEVDLERQHHVLRWGLGKECMRDAGCAGNLPSDELSKLQPILYVHEASSGCS